MKRVNDGEQISKDFSDQFEVRVLILLWFNGKEFGEARSRDLIKFSVLLLVLI